MGSMMMMMRVDVTCSGVEELGLKGRRWSRKNNIKKKI
jgi:hypothetical protein